MNKLITLIVLCLINISYAQTTISGKILDNKNQPIEGANVYLDGTYDGAKMPAADYWFKIKRPGKNKVYTGHFSLKR